MSCSRAIAVFLCSGAELWCFPVCFDDAVLLQLREKDTDGGDFCALAREVLEVARPAGVPVLINDRLDVVLASGADGAHVGQSDISMRDARRILGLDAIIGVSVATVEQVRCRAAGPR